MASYSKGIGFGKIAVKQGYISKEDLKTCIQKQKVIAEQEGTTPSLKEILLDTGFLSDEQADEIERIREQAARKRDINIPGYELYEKLGEGKSGVVYRAGQLSTNRLVAIKIFYPSITEGEAYPERLYQEARSSLAQLDHEGIIRGIDVGKANGLCYFVREYVEGSTLKEIIQEDGRLSEERAVNIGIQIARALKHAADNGLVHGEVTPKNILENRDGTAKLWDPGLTGTLEKEDRLLYRMSQTLGSPHYLSPEQANGEQPDIRSDIYALGTSLYHAVTGEVPFQSDDNASVTSKHLTEDPVPPHEREPSVSPSFSSVICKMMEKNPDARYTPDRLISDLDDVQKGNDPQHAARKQTHSRSKTDDRSVLNALTTWPAIAGLLLAGVVGCIAYFTFSPGGTDTGQTARETAEESTGSGDNTDSNASSKEQSTAVSKNKRVEPSREEQAADEFLANVKDAPGIRRDSSNEFDGKYKQGTVKKSTRVINRVLEQLADREYEQRFREHLSSDANLEQRARTYAVLNNFPVPYRNTSIGKWVEKRKAWVKRTILERLTNIKDDMERYVRNRSFSKAEETFRRLETFRSMDGNAELVAKLTGNPWNRRVRVTVNGEHVAADLSGFPVYVDLSLLPDTFFKHVNSKEELRVTTADGRTQLPREVVSLDTSDQTGELYFRANQLNSNSNTTFHILYDHQADPGPPEQSYQGDQVWTNNFAMTQHLNESAGASTAIDSTENNVDVPIKGDPTLEAEGYIRDAYSFDGNDDFLAQNVISGDTKPLTISLWYNHDNGTGRWDYFVGVATETALRINNGAPNYNWGTWDGSSNQGLKDVGSVQNGSWNHVVATVKDVSGGTEYKLFENGNLVAETVESWSPGSGDLHIGRSNGMGRYFQGRLDEVRFARTARSADWVATTYKNQSSPSTFLTISDGIQHGNAAGIASTDSIGDERVRDLAGQIAAMSPRKLIEDLSKVRTKYLRKRSNWERNRLTRAETLLREFKRKFQKIYGLADQSILQIADQKAQNLIDTYAEKIRVERVKEEVESYRADVNHLSYYRDLVKEGIQNIISSGRDVTLSSNEDGEEKNVKIIGLSGHVLKIRHVQELSSRSLSTLDIERRISIANMNNEEAEARDAFVLGLAYSLSGRSKQAYSLLKKASESGFDRANYYLKEVKRRTMSRRERKAQELIRSLERAMDSDLERAAARILSDLDAYRDTDRYGANRTKIHSHLQNIRYDPLTFLRTEGVAVKRKRLNQMLPHLNDWYSGDITQGTGIGAVELTYDFSKNNQVADWEGINLSGLQTAYDPSSGSVQFTGNGLLLHNLHFADRAHLQATVAMNNRIRNVGGVVMWSKDRGYRGMVNWEPPEKAQDVPDVIPAVLQKFQIPSTNGILDPKHIRLKNMSGSMQNHSGTNPGQMALSYTSGKLRFALEGTNVASATDGQFTRGRSGLLFENVRGRIQNIKLSGTPDWKWFQRKQKKQNKDGLSKQRKAYMNSEAFEGPLTYRDVDEGEIAFAMNLGGDAVQSGNVSFQEDPYTAEHNTSRTGTTSTADGEITAKKHEPVYRTQRHGEDLTYVFPLANGRYDVTLYFVEDRWEQSNKRRFNVFLQEKPVLRNFDVYSASGGKYNGITRTVRNIPVGNKRLYLDLEGVKQNGNDARATLSAISIKRSRRITSSAFETLASPLSERSGNQTRTGSSEQNGLSPENETPTPHWIWLNDDPGKETVYFRKQFVLPRTPSSATLYATCDNRMTAYVNGEQVLKHDRWESIKRVNVTSLLRSGTNVIAVTGKNSGDTAGLLVRMTMDLGNDRNISFPVTNDSWRVTGSVESESWNTTDYDDRNWTRAHSFGKLGVEPWGSIPFPDNE